MKEIAVIMVMFALVIFLVPLAVHAPGHAAVQESGIPTEHTPVFPDTVRLCRTDTGDIVTLTAEEYLTGCLAAVIPIDCEPEALKAQASACASYAMRLMSGSGGTGKFPEGADITDDARTCQPYMDENERAAAYGDDYGKFRADIEAAAKYGISHIITYNGEPIYAVYHAVSAGATCPAEYVWGRELPCLRSVSSMWDAGSRNFECTNELREDEARLLLSHYDPSLEVPVDGAKWFANIKANEYGYVISCDIGKNTFSGGDIWRIFGLRSTAFTVKYESGVFTFTTKGCGHGAGLSQYGANELAKRGSTADEILRKYYVGCSLTNS